MCGIAGIVDLTGQRPLPGGILERMADAIFHRGPDEDGYWQQPGIGLANRRLSIIGLADGKQPLYNEDRSVVAVFNGEFFEYPEIKKKLEAKGHVFRTHCDTELIPHLWEDYQEGMFEHLRGQFALACFDQKERRLILARDRFGICPLFWTEQKTSQGTWLLFASEIKALLASGLVQARPDVRGIDQVFNFFAVPGVPTCFEGISALQPGQYLDIRLGGRGANGDVAQVQRKNYWEMDFPDQGQEEDSDDPKKLVDEFERLMLAAVERRLRADVPVVSYLSGGIDSSIVVAMAAKLRGQSIPTFTIQIMTPHLDETSQAAVVSRHIGANPVVVSVGDKEVLGTYAELIRAAEAPVIDTSCAALLMLARSVHQHGYKVALTGEGSDEWLAGYAWYKIHRLLGMFDVIPGMPVSGLLRRGVLAAVGAPPGAAQYINRVRDVLGDHTAFQDIYGIVCLSRFRFFSPWMREALADHVAYLDVEPNIERMRRWSPMNRSLYLAGRIHLPGHLLSLKGDRVAMNSSVETRYAFLDEDVFAFLARIHPRWKMRGFRDKYILRLLCERYLPKEVAWRPKGMFRAPLDSFFDKVVPPFVRQLLSDESLQKTGYFDARAVQHWRQAITDNRVSIQQRSSIELGLVGVVATQLWHQTFIDGSLADLPTWTARTNAKVLATVGI
ncbi:MAG: asparagine synthase (glutamine-hydrolyzing) [Gemmataceae bacterium]|nr:asparagine synthase (glutamine-hydrolyzing) [Gemmataceae bacterium]